MFVIPSVWNKGSVIISAHFQYNFQGLKSSLSFIEICLLVGVQDRFLDFHIKIFKGFAIHFIRFNVFFVSWHCSVVHFFPDLHCPSITFFASLAISFILKMYYISSLVKHSILNFDLEKCKSNYVTNMRYETSDTCYMENCRHFLVVSYIKLCWWDQIRKGGNIK